MFVGSFISEIKKIYINRTPLSSNCKSVVTGVLVNNSPFISFAKFIFGTTSKQSRNTECRLGRASGRQDKRLSRNPERKLVNCSGFC